MNMEPRVSVALVAVALVSASLLAGCGAVGQSAASAAGQAPSVTQEAKPATGNAAFDARAALVAKAWQDGVLTAWTQGFVPLQELADVAQPKYTNATSDFTMTYTNGCIRNTSPLPDTTGRGVVRFPDGTSMPVALVGAQTAYGRFPKRSANCPMGDQPPWLTITSTRLSTVKILTSRGKAIVPAWHYTLAGLAQPLTSVAVAPSGITTLPQMTLPEYDGSSDGLVGAGGLISAKGEVVTFGVGIGACDKDLSPLVWETPELVLLGGSVTKWQALCTAQLLPRRLEIRTEKPVAERLVVDAVSGRPLLTFPWLLGP